MINEANIIEVVTLDKYTWTLYKRENMTRFPNSPYAVLLEKATPKGKYFKSKKVEHYVYGSLEAAEQAVTRTYGNLHANLKRRAKEAAEKKAAQATLKAADFFAVGDIVYNSWGYEQTNVEFYQVIKVTAKCIKVREIYSARLEDTIESHGMAWKVTACKDDFKDGGKEYQLRVKPEGRLSAPESYYYFNKWSGEGKYTSCYY